jgi:hypothetical protein
MTKRDTQAREYAAEADAAPDLTDAGRAARIAEFLREHGGANAAACVISWQDQAARLHVERRRTNDAMAELLEKYYALRDGPPRHYDREGKPPAESSD